VTIALGRDPRAVNEEHAKACFSEHYDNVRRVVPKEKLLEYRVGEGWQRLCEFLGSEIPEVQFPRTNDTKMQLELIQMWSWRVYRRSALRALLLLGIFISIGLAIYTANY
jgi:hypothetical protein